MEQYAPLEKATEIVTEALKLPRYRGEVAESDVGVLQGTYKNDNHAKSSYSIGRLWMDPQT